MEEESYEEIPNTSGDVSKQDEAKIAKTSMVEDKISWETWLQWLYGEGEEVEEE